MFPKTTRFQKFCPEPIHQVTAASVTLCYTSRMPNRLHRYYGAGYSHFITTSCYQRRPLLDNPLIRDLFLEVLEQVRRRYHFVVVGYVVMPEHVHLLLTEPQLEDPSGVMKALKQGFARRLLARMRLGPHHSDHLLVGQALPENGRIWQPRFYDFVVFSDKKRVEKLRYIHRNPLRRGLVMEPQDWPWSSFRHYAYDEPGPVLVNEVQRAALRIRESLDPEQHECPRFEHHEAWGSRFPS